MVMFTTMTSYLLIPTGVALLLVTLPVVLELTILTFASRLPRRPLPPSNPRMSFPGRPLRGIPLRLAVIVPAHNEGAFVASCVRSLRRSAAGTGTRIIVVAHNCSDRTAERAAQAGAEVLVYDDAHARGKGHALEFGFAFATCEGMDASLVVDADSTVSANLIGEVRAALMQGAQAVQCRYELQSAAQRPMSRVTALAFRGFNLIRPMGRDRLGLSAGILGNGFAVAQKLLKDDGYRSVSVVEALEFHIRLLLSGNRVRFLPQALVTSGAPTSRAGEAAQRSRWEGGRVNAAFTWLPGLLKQLLRGRPRFLEPVLDLLSLPLGYAMFLLLVAACLPLPWLRLYALGAIVVLLGHAMTAAWLGGAFIRDLSILFRVPGYILWKLWMLPRLLRAAHPDAAWEKTERLPDARNVDMASAPHGRRRHSMEEAIEVGSPVEMS